MNDFAVIQPAIIAYTRRFHSESIYKVNVSSSNAFCFQITLHSTEVSVLLFSILTALRQ